MASIPKVMSKSELPHLGRWTRKGGRRGRFVWVDIRVRREGLSRIEAAEDISVPIKP